MKIFTFIMSCYLLFLTCVPCGDGQECNVKSEVNISATTSHENHDHSEEACTPFCTCSCCPSYAFCNPLVKSFVVKPAFQSQKYHVFNITFYTEVFYNIWQPPQLTA